MRVLVYFTGTGVSKPSGAPIFRGSNGLYKNPKIFRYISLECREDPECRLKSVKRYLSYAALVSKLKPNAYHSRVRDLDYDKIYVITQTLDDLHDIFSGDNIVVRHIHGILRRRIIGGIVEARKREGYEAIYLDNEVGRIIEELSKREDLKEAVERGEIDLEGDFSLRRPDVRFFGERVDYPDEILKEIEGSEVDLVIAGTAAIVYPAAQVPYDIAERASIRKTIVVCTTPKYTDLPNFDFVYYRDKTPEAVVEEIKKKLSV